MGNIGNFHLTLLDFNEFRHCETSCSSSSLKHFAMGKFLDFLFSLSLLPAVINLTLRDEEAIKVDFSQMSIEREALKFLSDEHKIAQSR